MAATQASQAGGLILVTGSTGYVGGRLVPRLLAQGHPVRVMVRDPQRLQAKSWIRQVEVVTADALKPDSLGPALSGVEAAYYLIHSMIGASDFHGRDCRAARQFGQAAAAAGVERLIYLGGLGDPEASLSQHLRSRHLMGDLLRESGVPVIEFRASAIIGSGSASFELLRYSVEGMPIVAYPAWACGLVQPIGIRDVLSYLIAALQMPLATGRIIEIGGPDVLTYQEMLKAYARIRGLRRWIVAVPRLTPRMCAWLAGRLTPIPASLVEPLIEGLKNDTVVADDGAGKLAPEVTPAGTERALLRAFTSLQAGKVETTWQDAFGAGFEQSPLQGNTRQGLIMAQAGTSLAAPQAEAFAALADFGAPSGWHVLPPPGILLARLADRLRRRPFVPGRRRASGLQVDDIVEGWRVVCLEPAAGLRLEAVRHAGGAAWINLAVKPGTNGGSQLVVSLYFVPHGFGGLLYWYAMSPLHWLALRRIAATILSYIRTQAA